MNKKTLLNALFLLLSILLPFALFTFTRSDSLSFSDAGEFALVTKIASVAHGPGFPSYIMLGWIWCKIITLFTGSHLTSIILFSITSASTACGLLYLSCYRLLQRSQSSYGDLNHHLIALFTVLAFITGFTDWYWANMVEVYAFQLFTFSLMLYGLIEFNHSGTTKNAVICAVGITLGLANHHLTTIFFLPFVLVFLGKNIFSVSQSTKQGAKKKRPVLKTNNASLFQFFQSKQFKVLLIVGGGLLVFFYGWMMVRATADLPFKFGQPDDLSRLYYHVSGGAFASTMMERPEGIVKLRFPYFVWLFQRQFGFFILIIILGIVELFRKKYFLLPLAILGYFAIMQTYQMGIDQFFDSDGYMLSSYFLLCFAIPFGAIWLMGKRKELMFILPVLVLIQGIRNFPLDDKRDHDVSKSMMKSLDESAPKNSVIIAADWSLVIQYYYYRIAENFRPDLVLLNYDLKFNNYKTLSVMYPEFYKRIQPEYDEFIEKLRLVHPEQVYNTGASYGGDVFDAYSKVIYKIKNICQADNHALLFDPQAFVFLTEQHVLPTNYFASGCFVSEVKTDVKTDFEKLPFKWLDLPLLKYEANSSDKLVDIQAMLQFDGSYFNSIADSARYRDAVQSYDRIMTMQKELKSNLPFIYRKKEAATGQSFLK